LILIHSDLIGHDNALFLVLVAASMFALLGGIAFHEMCHALMATALGDTLPRRQGRVTLNPLAHLDPAGTFMMLFVGFGWGKPVQHNPNGLKIPPRIATLLVAAAGPLSNFTMAFILALPIKLGWVPYINPFDRSLIGVAGGREYAGLFVTGAVYLNVILGVFNLIPLPPLDGYNVAIGILPEGLSRDLARINQYGLGPLALLIIGIPIISSQLGHPYYPLNDIMAPTVIRLLRFFTGIG
jgi:Zn-dependent protease